MQFRDFKNVYQMLCETTEKYSDQDAYRWFNKDIELESVTWKGYHQQVRDVGKSLIALGVQKGDKINILSYTNYRWVLTDMASMSIGAVTVGIYQSNLPKDCQYIIDHSDAVVIFAENKTQLEKILEIKKDIPDIRKVVMINGDGPGDDWIISFEEFLALGKDIDDSEFDKRADEVTSDDLAGIVYTSGTTGLPKGAMLTHDNITSTCFSVFNSTELVDGEHFFVFLPLAHVFARTCVYTGVLSGNTGTFARGIDTLLEDFGKARPHWFVSVPRVFEKVYSKVISGVEAKGGITQILFNWACGVGTEVSNYRIDKLPIPFWVNFQYKIATKLIFSKIHKALGGNVKWCISGAAPLNPDIARFFHAAGLLILEGIGMTENTSFSNVNRQDNYDFGVVGPPGAGLEHRIADDGEVQFKGRNVMKGYYKQPDKTAETFTEDGWLMSGDLGKIDENNVLKITGRKKDLIITAGGKNIAPSAIEGLIATSKYLNQVCIIGDKRKYLSALVTLDEENIKDFAETTNIDFSTYEDLLKHEKVVSLINGIVAEKNKELPSWETLKKVTIVPEFTIENKMMTPTFKIKKNVIMDNYKEEINAMY